MRTQKGGQSLRSTSISRRTPYVCSSCRRNAFRSASTETSSNGHRPRYVPIALAGSSIFRWLQTSSRRPSPVDTPFSTISEIDEAPGSTHTAEAIKAQDRVPIKEIPSSEKLKNYSTREDIRSRLRKWSEEQSRLASTSETRRPSVSALPPNNSLLLDDIEPKDETDAFEKHEDNIEQEDETLYHLNPLALEPGDVFRVNIKGVHSQFAIFLGLRQMKRAEVLLADGRWAIALMGYPNTVILPGFAEPEQIDFLRSCISEHPNLQKAESAELLTDQNGDTVLGDLPMTLTENLTRRLSSLSEEIITFQRENTTKLDNLYTDWAHEDIFISHKFPNLVKVAFGSKLEDLSMGARYAIFATLRKNEGRHTIYRNKSNVIDVFFTPKTLYKQILDVTTWARQYQDCAARAAVGHDVSAELRLNPLNSFINKARRIILKSRKIRSPTTIGSLGPSSSSQVRADGSVVTRSTGENISQEDHSIIKFMWTTYLRNPSASQDLSARSIGALILRAIGAYPKMQLNLQIARLFFREMGLMAPWSEDMDDDLRIPAPGRHGAASAQKLIRDTDKQAHFEGFTSDRTNVPFRDTMADLRKDWGPTMVYCIDKPSTSVLDDGISLEESTDVPGAIWLHVHVAHPTAFVGPKSEYALRARTLTSAIYTSAKLYPMLPENMVNAMSLRPNAAVMTVSSLILKDGEVKDVRVSIGTIRNIIRLEPAAVATVLGIETVEEAVLQVGPTIAKSANFNMSDYQDADRHTEFIGKLQSVIAARTKKRREEFPDFPRWKVLPPRTSDYVSWTEIFDGSRHTRSYHYLGDPTIRITSPRQQVIRTWDESWEMSLDLTGHTMVLAGESIGRWLRDKKIPAVYNGAAPVDEEHSVARLNDMPDEYAGTGVQPRSFMSSKPAVHSLMGVAQYVRMTSPLRRYGDNVAQWQIDAYLRAEAEGRLRASGNYRGILPFTSENIERWIQEGGETARRLNLLKRKATTHWNMQAIFRAFHFNEAPLPAIWDAQITQPNFKVPRMSDLYQEPPDIADVVAYLQPFFLRALFLKSKEGWEVGVQRFQYLPVKIEYVDTTAQNVYVRAVGPPSWTATQSGPLLCVKPEHDAKIS